MSLTSTFEDLVRTRRSPRDFLPESVPDHEIRGALLDAQTAPSNSNTQPWVVHVVSGDVQRRLSESLITAYQRGHETPDFTATYGDGVHQERARAFGATYYQLREIARSDREGRADVMRENLSFFGAPHTALLFMPQLGDGVRTAGDVGMYAQTFLLSLTARGYRGIPQTVIGMYADTVRDVLGLPDDLTLLFGVAFGRADPRTPPASLSTAKVAPRRASPFTTRADRQRSATASATTRGLR